MKRFNSKPIKIVIAMLVCVVACLTVIAITPPKHAAAECNNSCVPQDVGDGINAYETSNSDGYQPPGFCDNASYTDTVTWAANNYVPTDDYSPSNPDTLPYNYSSNPGAYTLNMQIYTLQFQCWPEILGAGYGYPWYEDNSISPANYTQQLSGCDVYSYQTNQTCSNAYVYDAANYNYNFGTPTYFGGGTSDSLGHISGLTGSPNSEICFQNNTAFEFDGSPGCGAGTSAGFQWTPNPGLGAGTYTDTIYVPVQLQNQFIENVNGNLQYLSYCVYYPGVQLPPVGNTSECPWYNNTFTITFTVQSPPPPLYALDTASCNLIAGWAFDQADPSASIYVSIYVNGPAGSGAAGDNYLANVSRPDVDAAYGITGNHGFDINPGTDPFLSGYEDSGNPYTLYLYAISASGGPNVAFSNNPVTITRNGTCDDHPPNSTAIAACGGLNSDGTFGKVSGSATDQDHPGAELILYKITSNGSTVKSSAAYTSNGGAYSIEMSSYDQLQTYTVTVQPYDLNVSGGVGSNFPAPAGSSTATYGPCYVPVCIAPTFSYTGDINSAYDGLTPGQAFNMTESFQLNPANGAPALSGSTVWKSTTGMAFGSSTAGPYTHSLNNTAAFTASAQGPITYSEYFTDGPVSATGPCSNTTIVGFHPYFNVVGGDVSAGSGGFGTCTANTSAGILAFADGDQLFAYDFAGASGNLASIAPSLINGFSSDGSFTSSKTLAFANNNASNFFGGNYGYNGQCSPDYYGSAAAETGFTTPYSANTFNLNNISSAPSGECKVAAAATYYCWIQPSTYLDVSGSPGSNNIVLYVDGNSELDGSAGNILLSKTYASFPTLPSFWLVDQGNIDVGSNLSEVDGIFVAEPTTASSNNGYFTTCVSPTTDSQYTSSLYSSCKGSTLTVDGAVVAKQVRLNRTLGSLHAYGTTPAQPAEKFSYGPNTWMVNPLSATATTPTTASYNSSTDLPPVL